ncbi:MAG TPA: phosphodiester glycosidase family protein [Segetibacter sp.]
MSNSPIYNVSGRTVIPKKIIAILSLVIFFTAAAVFVFTKKDNAADHQFVSYTVDPGKQDLQMFWKDDKNEVFRSIQNLELWLNKQKRKLVFAMNGGMYKPGNTPKGLYIEKQVVLSQLDTSSGDGNFFLKPNGVFYITNDNIPEISETHIFYNSGKIKYATQSGPMLVINGQIHPAFNEGSKNLNIRNGVGILPDNKVVFAMSKSEINFYDFAKYFKNMGCKNALYLDGLVSRTYLPEKNWTQTDGDFGVIIGVTTVIE